MISRKSTTYRISDFVMYVVGFLLFWEWLRPLETITDTKDITAFVLYAAFAFAVTFLQFHLVISGFLKTFFLFYALHSVFFEGSFLQFSWIGTLIEDISVNVGLMLDARWWDMTDLFRSLLFFVLLWLMSYLMYYWIVQVKRIFIFILFTMAYVTILDTFTVYEATAAIVRTVILSFFVLGFLSFSRLKEREGVQFSEKRRMFFWTIPLIALIFFSVSLGYTAPKAAPQWKDPVPFLKSAVEKAGEGEGTGSGGIQKVGYGTNDSRLGGPFVGDDTPVFRAEVGEVHYWRVETKDEYTGKGWEVSEAAEQLRQNDQDIQIDVYENGVETTRLETTVKMSDNRKYPHIIYPNELKTVATEEPAELFLDPFTEKISTQLDGKPVEVSGYTMTYDFPSFSLKALKEASEADPAEIKEIFTKLPETLPERVRNLANEIVAGKTTRYDQAKAIEQYFANSGYVYDTIEVAVPGENEDYVDQFLFETKQGYCDNFSTSMVTLLRAVDIPSRWVKGYTQGEYIDTIDPETREYEVRDENAHSWVEVYFPEIGWVPFEPTRGFQNPFDFVNDTVNQNTQQPTPEKPEQEKKQEKPEEQQKNQSDAKRFDFSFELSVKGLVIVGVVMLAVGFGLFKTRKKWLRMFIITRYKRRSDDRVYFDAYRRLLRGLDRFGLKREEGQTLREYAKVVDRHFGSSDMRTLTARYERVLYRHEDPVREWSNSVELWENLIKKLTS